VPFGAAFAKALPFRMGQAHVQRYLRPLLQRIRAREIDPAFIVSHRLPLSRAPEAYRMWNDKTDDCTKIVLDPAA
jgi:threonine dehydrogenase-like Zn-dependent dehydrogenase